MPIYLASQEAERAVVARPMQPEQRALGAGGGEQARERARWYLDRLFVDGAVAVSNQLIFDAMQLSHRPHGSTVPAAKQQVTRGENSSEAGGPR